MESTRLLSVRRIEIQVRNQSEAGKDVGPTGRLPEQQGVVVKDNERGNDVDYETQQGNHIRGHRIREQGGIPSPERIQRSLQQSVIRTVIHIHVKILQIYVIQTLRHVVLNQLHKTHHCQFTTTVFSFHSTFRGYFSAPLPRFEQTTRRVLDSSRLLLVDQRLLVAHLLHFALLLLLLFLIKLVALYE